MHAIAYSAFHITHFCRYYSSRPDCTFENLLTYFIKNTKVVTPPDQSAHWEIFSYISEYTLIYYSYSSRSSCEHFRNLLLHFRIQTYVFTPPVQSARGKFTLIFYKRHLVIYSSRPDCTFENLLSFFIKDTWVFTPPEQSAHLKM